MAFAECNVAPVWFQCSQRAAVEASSGMIIALSYSTSCLIHARYQYTRYAFQPSLYHTLVPGTGTCYRCTGRDWDSETLVLALIVKCCPLKSGVRVAPLPTPRTFLSSLYRICLHLRCSKNRRLGAEEKPYPCGPVVSGVPVDHCRHRCRCRYCHYCCCC